MANYKFFTLLQTLNKTELKSFDQYLHGLYPGRNVQLRIFDYVKKKYPDFAGGEPGHEEIEAALFKNENPPKRKVTDALSDLYLLLQEFLAWRELKKNNFSKELILLRVFKERKLNTFFKRQLHSAAKKLNSKNTHNELDYARLLLLDFEQFSHSNIYPLKEQILHLKRYMFHLDHFFVISKLKLSAEVKSRTKIINEKNEDETKLLEAAKSLAGDLSFSTNPVLQIYPDLLDVLEYSDKAGFEQLKELIFEKRGQLSDKDFKSFLIYLINIAAGKIRDGETAYFNEVFKLYEYGIETTILFENGMLPHPRFINIIDVASNLRKFDYAENFIRKYRNNLDNKFKKNTLSISKARIFFSKDDFEGTIKLLREVQFTDFYFALKSKSLILRSFYKLDEELAINSFCFSFEQYLRRNKLIGRFVKKGYRNLIKIIRLLAKKKKSKKQLLEIIQGMDFLACKDWVLVQITTMA